MDPDLWHQVEELFEAALAKQPHERGAFLSQAGVSDEARREVVSLLSECASGGSPLDRPAWHGAICATSDAADASAVRLASGTLLGPYRIEDELGEGAMGIVYRAQDTRLSRHVAIKFLSDASASTALRLRFQREARMASALNHPHIITVHDTGELDGRLYIVTEFVDGGTLRDWHRRGRTWEEVIDLLAGVADGLASAHAAGILHRDIKPANILVSGSGYAKLADFGLAKFLDSFGQQGLSSLPKERAGAHGDSFAIRSTQQGLDAERTIPGAIVGTIAYMSPEQATGGPVDARSDIFSFGVVLYEALAGHRPFVEDSEFELPQNNPSRKPAPLPAHIPAALRAVVERAIEQDADKRYRSMDEMAKDLRNLQRVRSDEAWHASARQAPAGLAPRRVAIIGSAAIAVIALGAISWALWRGDYFWHNPLDGARIERLTDFDGDEVDAAVSPDGKLVAFLSDRDGPYDAWVTQAGTGHFVNLTKGRFTNLDPAPIRKSAFSADGGRIWVPSGDGRIQPHLGWLTSVVSGDPYPFAPGGMEIAFSPDGTRIVYHTDDPGDPLFVSDANGNNPKRIFVAEPGGHCHHPTWSPDSRFIYFVKGVPENELDIWRVPAESFSQAAERITRHNANVGYPAWLDDRTLIYSATGEEGSGRSLYALDVNRRDDPHRVSSGVLEEYHSVAASAAYPRRLVCTVATPEVSLWTIPLTERTEPETSARRVAISQARALGPAFARDDLLFLSSRSGIDSIWRSHNGTSAEVWRDSSGGVMAPPSPSPDGRRICFWYRKKGRMHLAVINADGTNLRLLGVTLDIRSSASWSPDSRQVAVAASDNEGTRIYIVPVDSGPSVRLTDGPSYNPVWSPDGAYIVYSQPLRGPHLALKAVALDRTPVTLPSIVVPYTSVTPYRFAARGKSLIFMRDTSFRARNFWQVDLDTGAERQLTDLNRGDIIANFDVSPDGRQIVFDRRRDNADVVMLELRQ